MLSECQLFTRFSWQRVMTLFLIVLFTIVTTGAFSEQKKGRDGVAAGGSGSSGPVTVGPSTELNQAEALPRVDSISGKSEGIGDGSSADDLGGTIRLTWEDVAKTVERHPLMGAGQHAVEAARYEIAVAREVDNPTLAASGSYGRAVDGSAQKFEWGLALSIPLDWLATQKSKVDVAETEVTAATAEVTELRSDILLQLKELFWKVVYRQELVSALEQLNGQVEALFQTVEKRVENGEARPIEVVRVQVELEKIAGELEVAKLNLASSRTQLGIWLTVKENESVVAVADLSRLPTPVSAKATRLKVAVHPKIAVADARVKSQAAVVEAERKSRFPAMSVEIFTDHELDRRAVGIGVEIDLPIWNWNTGNIQRSKQTLLMEKQKVHAQKLQLENEAVSVQASCEGAVSAATRYRSQVLPKAEAVARVIERTYQLGEASLLELNDARRTLLETKTQFLGSLVSAQIECSRLSSLIGEEL